jgi:hypothetical protein
VAKKVASFRLDEGLLERVAAYAKSRGTSQAIVIEAAVQGFMEDAEGGVPDLPVSDTPEVREKRAAAVKPEPQQETYAQLLGARHRRLAREMGW